MKRKHDDERDVYVDGRTYRKSSAWQRRLRRTARKNGTTALIAYGRRDLADDWFGLARNG